MARAWVLAIVHLAGIRPEQTSTRKAHTRCHPWLRADDVCAIWNVGRLIARSLLCSFGAPVSWKRSQQRRQRCSLYVKCTRPVKSRCERIEAKRSRRRQCNREMQTVEFRLQLIKKVGRRGEIENHTGPGARPLLPKRRRDNARRILRDRSFRLQFYASLSPIPRPQSRRNPSPAARRSTG